MEVSTMTALMTGVTEFVTGVITIVFDLASQFVTNELGMIIIGGVVLSIAVGVFNGLLRRK